ncbi:response regulator [Haladaptatus sp. F3-133]|uniref:Response regulator n=1 Tax=Halorutilus salinus TaxID=2487751 RepID=A0A9Q4GFR4_9EURY|nr:response regulator [Halorutilus salinus]MCX2818419.1 response regulator [Halorutilus salinus]
MSYRIIVVDDSEFMRTLLKEILEETDGFKVVDEAENGVEAVEKYEEHDADIVMMDIVMPIKDGIEATQEVKNTAESPNVIMCTSVGQEEKMKEAVKAGADGYITKPFEKPSVVSEIKDVVG